MAVLYSEDQLRQQALTYSSVASSLQQCSLLRQGADAAVGHATALRGHDMTKPGLGWLRTSLRYMDSPIYISVYTNFIVVSNAVIHCLDGIHVPKLVTFGFTEYKTA